MLEKDISLPSVKWVTTGAESLMRNQKQAIEQAFAVQVTDVYGLGESVASMAMCPEGNYHVDEDFACTEFVPVPGVSSVWRIIGTNFTNPAFPLIRFDSNDLAVLKPGRCPCGRPGRIVSEIIGRIEDFIVTKDGARFRQPGFFFMGIMNIREGQMVQTAPDRIEFRIVKGPQFNHADEELLLSRARERIGDGIEYEFIYVDAIERSPSGKIKCLVSQIEDNADANPEDWLYKT
jgi:phenylacetate-CoA ligase